MTLVPWTPDPEPFGNATGFDTVALDVKVRIAERMGMTVTIGRFPDDYQTVQEEDRERGRSSEKPRPIKAFTISHDGLTVSGDYDGRSHIRGYWSSYWLDSMTPETLVFDFRTLTWDQARTLAVRGPMLGVDLPDGMVSKLGPIDPMMAAVADNYMRHAGASLAETGAEVT